MDDFLEDVFLRHGTNPWRTKVIAASPAGWYRLPERTKQATNWMGVSRLLTSCLEIETVLQTSLRYTVARSGAHSWVVSLK